MRYLEQDKILDIRQHTQSNMPSDEVRKLTKRRLEDLHCMPKDKTFDKIKPKKLIIYTYDKKVPGVYSLLRYL